MFYFFAYLFTFSVSLNVPNFYFFSPFLCFLEKSHISILTLPIHTHECPKQPSSLLYPPHKQMHLTPNHTPIRRSPTALRLGSLVSGILSSKSRSSQMSDSRQTPTSSVQSKSLHSGGELPCFVSLLLPGHHWRKVICVSNRVPLMFS